MSDLHTHHAVVHLMTTEYWPTINNGTWRLNAPNEKGLGWCWLPHPLGDKNPDWYDETENESVAHSLLTLAAVRAMWDHRFGATIRMFPVRKEHNTVQDRGWPFPGFVCCVDPDPAKISSVAQWSEPVEAAAPTEPLAILEAYRATVMEGGK